MKAIVSRDVKAGRLEVVHKDGKFSATLAGKPLSLYGNSIQSLADLRGAKPTAQFASTVAAAGYTHALGLKVGLHADEAERLRAAHDEWERARAVTRGVRPVDGTGGRRHLVETLTDLVNRDQQALTRYMDRDQGGKRPRNLSAEIEAARAALEEFDRAYPDVVVGIKKKNRDEVIRAALN